MKGVLPVLGLQGFITDPLLTGSIMFEHYRLANFTQTNNFPGAFSIAHQLREGDDDPDKVLLNIKQSLEEYYDRMFDNVVVEIEEIESDSTKLGFVLRLKYDSDGKTYDIANALKISANNKIDVFKISDKG